MRFLLLILCIIATLCNVFGGQSSALFDYVNMPDPNYKYEPLTECDINGIGFKAFAFNMTSQQWLDEKTL